MGNSTPPGRRIIDDALGILFAAVLCSMASGPVLQSPGSAGGGPTGGPAYWPPEAPNPSRTAVASATTRPTRSATEGSSPISPTT